MSYPANDHAQPVYLGIDVGGTNTKIGLVADDGQVIAAESFPTDANASPLDWLPRLKQHYSSLLSHAGMSQVSVAAAGLGTPGSMDISRGMILSPPNLPGWRDFPIRDAVADAVGLKVTFANDANAAAFGEFWVGGARAYSSLLFLTLGTGIGGGIIIDGTLVEGAHSLGGEVGHLTIDWAPDARLCGCGQRGHLEAYASATALVARARQSLNQHQDSVLRHTAAEPLTARGIGWAANQGDSLALELVRETADYLARGIAAAAMVIDPQAVLLGGAMTFGEQESAVGRAFLQRVSQQTRQLVFPTMAEGMIIDFAALGSDAGMIGAAGLARWERTKR